MHTYSTARRIALVLPCLFSLLVAPIGATGPSSASAAKRLKVVATTPGLADVVRQIGGERVEVKSLTKGTEDMHSVVVTPRMLVSLKKADVLVQVGFALESAWLPPLVLRTRNAAIGAGGLGLITVSEGWQAIAVPESLSRQQGHLHPQGNPHFLAHPEAGPHVVEQVRAGLTRLDAAGGPGFDERARVLTERMVAARGRWEQSRERLSGIPVIVYHQEFDYLLLWLGMSVFGTIESRPGIPPTPAHLARLVSGARGAGVKAVLTARWSNNRQVKKTARDLSVPVLELPTAVGGEPWATDWIAWVDGTIARLEAALAPPPPPPSDSPAETEN